MSKVNITIEMTEEEYEEYKRISKMNLEERIKELPLTDILKIKGFIKREHKEKEIMTGRYEREVYREYDDPNKKILISILEHQTIKPV